MSRMSAPSSPTQDGVKMDTAVQASLSLPATPLSKGLDNAFANPAGICGPSSLVRGQTGNPGSSLSKRFVLLVVFM